MGYGSITSASDAAVSALEVHQREIERRLCKVEREVAQIEPKLERLHTRVRNDILQSILLGVYGVVVVATIVLIVATAVVRAG